MYHVFHERSSSRPSFKTTNSLRSQSSETWSLEVQRVRLTKVLKNHASPNTPITAWYKHGFEYLFLPPTDLTQCMDVSPNPGPTFAHVSASKRACSYATHVPVQGMQFTKPNPFNQRLFTVADNEPRFVYQRKDLLAFNVA